MLTISLIVLSILFIVISTTRYNVHPFLALLVAAFFFGLFSGMPLEDIISTINAGFGGTLESIGLIIIIGVIIGTFLENSGGAYALANAVLKIFGKKSVHSVMAVIGYIVSVPVFADSGFIILSSLNRALSKRAKVSLAGTAVVLALGLTATHTMVPPTPGPIAAAGIIGADLGIVILIGLYTSICALIICIIFAKKYAGKIYIDPAPELSDKEVAEKLKTAPSAVKSFLPIIIPIILIVFRSVAEYPTNPFGSGQLKVFISFIGNPVTALFIGMLLSFLLPEKLDKKMMGTAGWVGKAMQNGAIIILITGAGGAFGRVLQSSEIGVILGDAVLDSNLGIWLPFLVAAGIKSAQGSSTVALITAASLIVPLIPSMGMESEISKAMVVIAIGAGSTVVSHANDSFFWVVTRMSDMNVKQGYQLHTLGTGILGFSAMLFLSILNIFIN
ncbi:MAG: GntP family permease [Balneolaceae bacterium]